MHNLFLAAAFLAASVVAAPASEWMGSLSFTKGFSGSSEWTAKIGNDGSGKMKTEFGKLDVQKSNSFFIVSTKSAGIIGTGFVTNGHVAGTFRYDGAAGTFMGDRTSKGSKGSKGSKKGKGG